MGLFDTIDGKRIRELQEKIKAGQSISQVIRSEKASEEKQSTSSRAVPQAMQQPSGLPQRNIASATLYSWDSIDLSGFDSQSIDLIHQFIPSAWPGGIQSSMVTPTSNMIKLKGRPWASSSLADYNVVSSRRLVCTILEILWDNGWKLQAAVSVTGTPHSRDSWLFRKQPVHRRYWMAIHFVWADAFLVIDAPPELNAALHAKFQHFIQDHGDSSGAYYIKLRGYPFAVNGGGNEATRLVLMDMTEVLDQFGYFIYTSVDLTSAEHGRDSWICCTN